MSKQQILDYGFYHCPKCPLYDDGHCHYIYCGCENICPRLLNAIINDKNRYIRQLKNYIKRKGI